MNRAGTRWIFSSLQEGQRRPCGPLFTLSGAKAVPPSPAWLARPGALLRRPRFPLPCQPPSPAQQLVLRTNCPSLAGAVARPRKACVSFNTAGPAGAGGGGHGPPATNTSFQRPHWLRACLGLGGGVRRGGHDSTGRPEPQPKRRRPRGNGPSSGSCFPCPQPQPAALGSRPAEWASVNSSGITGQRPWRRLCGRMDSCGRGGGQ